MCLVDASNHRVTLQSEPLVINEEQHVYVTLKNVLV